MSKKNIFSNNEPGAAQPAEPPKETTQLTPQEPAAPATQEQTTPTEETTTPASEQPTEPEPPAKIRNPQRAIDANLINALKPFVSTDESRYVLQGICFTTNEDGKPVGVATNGRTLAMAEQLIVDANDYPAFPNGGVGQDTKDDIIVPVKPLMESLRKVPKKTCLPILQTPPIISLRNDKGEVTQACVPVTDLSTHSIETTRVIDGRFPNYRQVIPPENRTAIEVVLDANFMLDMAQAALAFCKNGSAHAVPMKLCVGFENHGPLRVEVKDQNQRRLTMVAMPMRDCGELVNRIDTKALQQVTGRLEAIASQLETIGQKKATRKPKAEKAEAPVEPVAKAA